MRGLAACLVLIRHVPETTRAGDSLLEAPFQWTREIGWVGVDLFFVLSGLLISSLIYREFDRDGSFNASRFLLRRSFKIWPSYFAAYGSAMLLRWLVAIKRGNTDIAAEVSSSAVWNVVFLQNYVDCERWPHSWSIAVEEHFYLGLALLLFVWIVWRGPRGSGSATFRFLPGLWMGVAGIVLLLRTGVSDPEFDWKDAYYPTHMRIDGLLFGVAIGYFVWYREATTSRLLAWRHALAGCGLLAFLWPTIWKLEQNPQATSIGFTLIYLCFGMAVLLAAMRPSLGRHLPQPLSWVAAALAWIGVYSYTIYLAHSVLYVFPGMAGLRERALSVIESRIGVEGALWADRLTFIGGSIALGVALSHAVERPFLRIRARVDQRWRRPVAVSASESALASQSAQ
jgi:peptidoglycan/LPS O-acetylase OafA/YrhL